MKKIILGIAFIFAGVILAIAGFTNYNEALFLQIVKYLSYVMSSFLLVYGVNSINDERERIKEEKDEELNGHYRF